jgi:hypothetical protein
MNPQKYQVPPGRLKFRSSLPDSNLSKAHPALKRRAIFIRLTETRRAGGEHVFCHGLNTDKTRKLLLATGFFQICDHSVFHPWLS